MRSRHADRRIILSLLAALVVETVLLLWHLGVISWHRSSSRGDAAIAGIVLRSENDLRRRGVNSLVWEEAGGDETVYYYDSVLTLSQSTAVLKLAGESEISLSENTLVTIEPRTEAGSGEIRLRFTRGNLSARNPFKPTSIAAPDFSVEVSEGSELSLRQTGEKDFELRMVKGSASVAGKDGVLSAAPGKLLRMQDGIGTELELDESLRWVNAPPARVYSHSALSEVLFQWGGSASQFRLQTSGAPEQVVDLQPAQRSLKMFLGFGDHVAYLREGESSSSEGLGVRVWRAPLLHLLLPLPRNRVRTEEMTFFMWTRVPEASRYEFRLKGARLDLREGSVGNGYQKVFAEEDDAEWGVWAVDREGFEIPPLYQYPIFIRHAPFEAPLLNAPKLRKPAKDDDRGASLMRQIFSWIAPVAYAEEIAPKMEAVFSWQPVRGADLYVLEISASPDFRAPLVSKKLSRTEFVWRGYDGGEYFWRVAAGSKSGRMGVFSEPAAVAIESGVEIRTVAPKESGEVVKEQVKATDAAKPSEDSMSREAPKVMDPPEVAKALTPADDLPFTRVIEPRRTRIFWRGGFGSLVAKEAQQVHADLNGLKYASAAAERDVLVREDRWWTVSAKYSRSKFTPKSTEDYPFQDDLVIEQGELLFSETKSYRPWGWGISLLALPAFEREAFEEITAKTSFFGGAHIRSRWNFRLGEYQLDFGLIGGQPGYGYHTSHRFLFRTFADRMLMGVGTENAYILRGSYNLMTVDGFVNLGFEF